MYRNNPPSAFAALWKHQCIVADQSAYFRTVGRSGTIFFWQILLTYLYTIKKLSAITSITLKDRFITHQKNPLEICALFATGHGSSIFYKAALIASAKRILFMCMSIRHLPLHLWHSLQVAARPVLRSLKYHRFQVGSVCFPRYWDVYLACYW